MGWLFVVVVLAMHAALEIYCRRLLYVCLSVDNVYHLPDRLGGSLIQLLEHGVVHQVEAKVHDDVKVLNAGKPGSRRSN